MWPSIVDGNKQLDPQCSMQTYHAPVSHLRPSPHSL